jgi:hypothetical protein
MPTPVPAAALSNTALAPGPATRVTPAGTPEPRKPVRTAAVVPSDTLLPSGNSSMRWVSVAPSVRVKWIPKSVGAAYDSGL